VTVAVDLVEALTAAIEQAGPEARARLRAALEVEPSSSQPVTNSQTVYTPATLAAELGRTPRAIRAAIARGELDAVKRGRGWVIPADAVERWAATGGPRGPRARAPRRAPGRGPMGRALASG
jgi:excisionase family DNA binding protein